MTTSAVYDLIPNYDNTQHTQYPQGDKPEESLIQAPTNLQTSGETLTSVDTTWDMVEGYHTHFILQRWRLNTDTAWTEITQPDELDRAYTDSADLLEGQHVGYRIAASDGANQSDWSTEAWTYVLTTATGGDPIFADDFSTYNLGDTLVGVTPPISVNGANWWHTASGNPPYIVADGYGGDPKALGFDFKIRTDEAKDYAYSEQRFKLCTSPQNALDEIWIEYYVYWPSEYAPVISSHNKTMFLMSDQFGDTNGVQHPQGDMWSSNEQWISGDKSMASITQNVHKGYADGHVLNWGHAHEDWGPTDPVTNFAASNFYNPTPDENQSLAFWRAADSGNWRRYRYHVRVASASGYDALCRVWKDNTLVAEIKDSNWKDENGVKWDSGYLFGWQSGSVATNCIVKMSRIKMYASDPNWSFS